MNPNLCRVVLRPRSAFEVFDLVLRFVHQNRGPLLRLTALTVVLPWLVLAPIGWWFEGVWWVALLPIPLFPFVQAPFTVLGGRLLFKPEVTVREALVQTVRQLGSLMAVSIVGVVGLGVSAATCFYGYLPLMAALLYVPETALLERVGLQRGLQRSMRLAGGHVGLALAGAFGRVFLTVWCVLVAEGFGQALLDTTLQLGRPFGALSDGSVTPFVVFGLLISQPIHALYRLFLYVDVRTRMEGWDLQVGLRAAGLARAGRR